MPPHARALLYLFLASCGPGRIITQPGSRAASADPAQPAEDAPSRGARDAETPGGASGEAGSALPPPSGVRSDAGAADGGPPATPPPTDVPIARTPSPCPTDNAPFGEWTEVTPPGVDARRDNTYGTSTFVINPKDPAIVTLGTDKQGIWQTRDCGATWSKINTGRNGAGMDQGAQWSMIGDPQEPDTLYANSGYGPNGLFKSTNGGKDWDQILSDEVLSEFIYGGFVLVVRMDPQNHLHLTVTPHFECVGSHAPNCIGESLDGGQTWRVLGSAPPPVEGGGHVMESANVWYFARGFDGLYRTENAGASWDFVGQRQAYSSGTFYMAPSGRRYMPALLNVISSMDGRTWTELPSSPNAGMVAGTDKHVIAGAGSCVIAREKTSPVWVADADNPTSWTQIPGLAIENGPTDMHYDPDHKLLYISACRSGFWRVRVDL